ncbi:leucine-rich repeat domain-containing protein [Paenibacillus sp. JX-17]|uniref:Leucine-rich repeat domain-containing protein n=1 Tax=Paenibacillus lacisoli TaxID=3064525 RepID=A0ABT9CES7_9BACL|nr:leucine-rich repeat domain-containing protein [Paenibacillus sp. JX-17]MDO7907775.1 leucine-rich repeat domain-containing protein [Paenibacillus sp. JX-17]
MQLYTDPRGQAYQQIIDVAVQHSEYFVLGEKFGDAPDVDRSRYWAVLNRLEPYLEKKIVIDGDDQEDVSRIRETYRSHAFYTAGTYYWYRCCEESGQLLKQVADRLSDWIYPNLPEDLCFVKKGGGDYLYSIVHERMYGMEVTEDEAVKLMERIPGLFLKLKAHRNLDGLLDDAIRHKTDWLYISRHGLTELPDRIRKLTELRELEIFEQDVYRLPEGLFELTKLESLTIMSAELEAIPASIQKLKNLKKLNICCASSNRPAPGWKPKPKEEISLNRIPPEIGELERLEELTIQYTSIQTLPPELEKLTSLRYLNLGMGMIKQKPAFLRRMKQLKYVTVAQDSLY